MHRTNPCHSPRECRARSRAPESCSLIRLSPTTTPVSGSNSARGLRYFWLTRAITRARNGGQKFASYSAENLSRWNLGQRKRATRSSLDLSSNKIRTRESFSPLIPRKCRKLVSHDLYVASNDLVINDLNTRTNFSSRVDARIYPRVAITRSGKRFAVESAQSLRIRWLHHAGCCVHHWWRTKQPWSFLSVDGRWLYRTLAMQSVIYRLCPATIIPDAQSVKSISAIDASGTHYFL